MINAIQEIEKALDAGLYNCALALTLTLPDICAKVEYADQTGWSKGEKYRAWFERYAKEVFTYDAVVFPTNEKIEVNTINGAECWKLRCSVLHAGNYEVRDKESRYERYVFHAHRPESNIWEHELISAGVYQADVIKFCRNICDVVYRYYMKSESKKAFRMDEVHHLTW